ncbi:MAG: methyltransferase, TIGR04325 family [Acidobacteriaceae bacterium]
MGHIAKSILLSPQCKAGVDWLEERFPLLRKWHRFEYDQHFDRVYQWQRMFSGVYPSFEAAEKAISTGKTVGFDHLETAAFLGQKARILPSDYPVMYWLRELMGPSTRIFDFGGYTGITYRAYAPYLHYPQAMEWIVYDVPAVIAAARKHHKQAALTETHLRFTDNMEDANCADLFLASGSLHYCKKSLSEYMEPLVTRPRYLLLSKLPLISGAPFVTLQNMGPAITPYRIFNVDEFTQEIKGLGYRVVDTWSNPDVACYIPFHPDNTVKEFTGMLLCLE